MNASLLLSGDQNGSYALIDGEIRVDTSILQPEKIRLSLQHWYQGQALAVFGQRLQAIARRVVWAGDREIPLKLRRMKRTWGNCSSTGVIKLNTHMVKAPLRLVDSVIAHELCHLEVMNHSREFYRLLQSLNPNWRHDRACLRAQGFIYLLT